MIQSMCSTVSQFYDAVFSTFEEIYSSMSYAISRKVGRSTQNLISIQLTGTTIEVLLYTQI